MARTIEVSSNNMEGTKGSITYPVKSAAFSDGGAGDLGRSRRSMDEIQKKQAKDKEKAADSVDMEKAKEALLSDGD